MKAPTPTLPRWMPSPSIAVCALVIACSGATQTTDLQAQDLTPARGLGFNPDEIIPYAAFTDGLALGPAEVQMFLERTPYGAPSFLATYQSSGEFAADAIMAAAATYRISPLVFLVEAEVAGGLIGAKTYPLPSRHVEYVFGCGCTSPSSCDASFAGFDKQVDCLGSTLRTNLDQIAVTGATAGGWAPGVAAVSVDGVHVTPADASTAALYQYDPVVGRGKSDNWLVWNIWQLYANALMYSLPPDPAADATAQIGDGCRIADDCAFGNPICEIGASYPGGLCTTQCNAACPGVDSFCANFSGMGYCLAVCNPTDPASCRAGYTCMLISQYGGSQAENVCAPP